MSPTRDSVWHAGRLVQWALRPLARPAQESEYRELVERYFDDGGFRVTVRELADGLGLQVLDVSEHGCEDTVDTARIAERDVKADEHDDREGQKQAVE